MPLLPLTINNKQLTINWRRSRPGFSLIELLVVISIIGILLTTITASFTNAQQKGRDTRRKSDLKSIQQALEIYFQTNGKYPGASAGQIQCNVTGDSNARNWGTEFFCDQNGGSAPAKVTYINQLPKDPLNTSPNIYCYTNFSAYAYSLNSNLENANDSEKLSTPVSCNGRNYNYSVSNP